PADGVIIFGAPFISLSLIPSRCLSSLHVVSRLFTFSLILSLCLSPLHVVSCLFTLSLTSSRCLSSLPGQIIDYAAVP
ncbi:MAG TPA: hypothetical protein PKE28_12945, partial [Bacteroidales bacterium]|nr:hypothetical protein [Bacteroidales bacterium]